MVSAGESGMKTTNLAMSEQEEQIYSGLISDEEQLRVQVNR